MSNEIYGIEGVRHLFPQEVSKGIASISHISFSEKQDPFYNLRAIRDDRIFRMFDGDYTRLVVNGELMMSDTGMERISNKTFIKKANGNVLIAGLGIGLIINAIRKYNENVTSITVIEKYQDVIDLVGDKFKDVNIICADIDEWLPAKGQKYDTIYFDIWPDVNTDNLKHIKTLHNRFKNKLNRENPNCFMDSWMKEYLQGMKRRNY